MRYIINERTKEHRVLPSFEENPDRSEWVEVKASEDGWITFIGTQCPVPLGQYGDFKRRDGRCYDVDLSLVDWSGDCDKEYTIVAYRPYVERQDSNIDWHINHSLPPVGTVCEAVCSDGEWHEVTIVHTDDSIHEQWMSKYTGIAVFKCPISSDLKYYWQTPNRFRPIRSEKEKTIDAMMELWNKSPNGCPEEKLKEIYETFIESQ